MDLNQWFQKGMRPEAYIHAMQSHQANLLYIFDHFQLPDDEAFFQKLNEKNIRAIAITEDWCTDAMLNIPILLSIAHKTDVPVRMILRDSNLELMDQYLTNGTSRSIPVFIFLDEEGNELASWGSRAEKVEQFSNREREKLPPNDSPDYKEKFQVYVDRMTDSYSTDEAIWQEVYNSLKQTLEKI